MTPHFSTPTARGKYHGVLQIVAFNWTKYVTGLLVFIAALVLAAHVPMPAWVKVIVLAGSGCALFWMLVSLLASHYVYDRSKLYRWSWIADRFPAPPKRAVNIHAGLDESSDSLKRLFPESGFAIWDMHDPGEMTEASIARARQKSVFQPSTRAVDYAALPAENASFDAVFLLFAAHELRSPDAREKFFRELHRVLEPSGELLMVEHLRDWKNFIAYGPGFLHFLPRREWLRLSREAGFEIATEFSITAFVRVFHLRKPV
jgi:SAM-dependent methyltransferase